LLCREKDTLLFDNKNDHVYHKYWKCNDFYIWEF